MSAPLGAIREPRVLRPDAPTPGFSQLPAPVFVIRTQASTEWLKASSLFSTTPIELKASLYYYTASFTALTRTRISLKAIECALKLGTSLRTHGPQTRVLLHNRIKSTRAFDSAIGQNGLGGI